MTNTMVLERQNTLIMPSNYEELNREEMTYVDGGSVYISNSTLVSVCQVVFGCIAFNPIGTVLAAIGISKAYTMLCAGVTKIAAKIGIFSKILGVAFAIMGIMTIKDVGLVMIDALLQGKGVEIKVKTTWFGLPYGLEGDVC